MTGTFKLSNIHFLYSVLAGKSYIKCLKIPLNFQLVKETINVEYIKI